MRTREPAGAVEVFVLLYGLMPFGGWYKTCQNRAVLAAQKTENWFVERAAPAGELAFGTGLGSALVPCPSYGHESS